ncbi:MAG: hypothetical protein JWR33_1821 [Naasia sp.]|uniref:hypothetical protein n=1 Tax=Naasia sp. TaxID=2546198 RepID=UPI002632806B|nr:hypothetical protein [Naasia sp.]MCU1571080.1 hypothetical protein [Naasia sp.]
MEWIILGSVSVAAVLALSIAARGSAQRSARGSGSVGTGMMGAFDEIYAPSRHEAMLEFERQTSLPAPAPVAGDPDLGVYEGRIRIKLSGGRDTRID